MTVRGDRAVFIVATGPALEPGCGGVFEGLAPLLDALVAPARMPKRGAGTLRERAAVMRTVTRRLGLPTKACIEIDLSSGRGDGVWLDALRTFGVLDWVVLPRVEVG